MLRLRKLMWRIRPLVMVGFAALMLFATVGRSCAGVKVNQGQARHVEERVAELVGKGVWLSPKDVSAIAAGYEASPDTKKYESGSLFVAAFQQSLPWAGLLIGLFIVVARVSPLESAILLIACLGVSVFWIPLRPSQLLLMTVGLAAGHLASAVVARSRRSGSA